MARIVLKRRVVETADHRHELRAWVAETTNNIPGKVFVYQRIPAVPLYEEPFDILVHVASYTDITDFPEDAPEGRNQPFFRKHYLHVVFDSLAILEKEWTRIKTQVRLTVEDIARLNQMDPVEIVEITA